jgi:hypothetical protein
MKRLTEFIRRLTLGRKPILVVNVPVEAADDVQRFADILRRQYDKDYYVLVLANGNEFTFDVLNPYKQKMFSRAEALFLMNKAQVQAGRDKVRPGKVVNMKVVKPFLCMKEKQCDTQCEYCILNKMNYGTIPGKS